MENMVKKVLVTGNNGYIGSVLCDKLRAESFEVKGLDTNFYKNCHFFEKVECICGVSKDIRKIEEKDISEFDAIIHLAALSNDPVGALNPEITKDINYQATVRLAKLAKESGVKRFLFSSSCSIYGISGQDDAVDEDGKLSPLTEYASSKVESERAIGLLSDDNFSPVFLRNATVYGVSPMLRVDLVINNLVAWAHTTGSIRIMSDGSPWRPLIHVQDISKAFIAVLKAPKDLIHNQTFNVGCNSENYRIMDIGEAIKKVMPDCRIEYTGEHGVDSRSYRVDFSKFSEVLGDYYKPVWNIERGIEELRDMYTKEDFSENDFHGTKFTRLKTIKKLLEEGQVDKYLFWR